MHHLLGLEDLSANELTAVLDRAETFRGVGRETRKRNDLAGKLVVNLFFEPSTRTKISFALATRRLGGETQDFSPSGSSTSKGETLIDTAKNIAAMGIDAVVVRHTSSGAPKLLAETLGGIPIVNAGDGAHEHPTQALLDALTIRRNKGRIDELTVAICGDILHSRVARSNIILLTALGARVRVIAPSTLLPAGIDRMGVEVYRDMRAGLKDADIVMMLRLQRERMNGGFVPSSKEYFRFWGLDEEKHAYARPDALVLHPGPMNRGVEIDGELADDINRSVIQDQVEMGVAVRMACMDLLARNLRAERGRQAVGVMV